MEVGYLLKSILVVLVFFGLAFLVKILVMYFHVPKKSMMKDMCLQRKMYVTGMRPHVGRSATASEKWLGHDPVPYPNGPPFCTNSNNNLDYSCSKLDKCLLDAFIVDLRRLDLACFFLLRV